uniref:GDSL esterase/lipase At5g03980-like n=1 Tax=Nicotiana tabacum TaxID=4097 RepID=A0A1S4D8P5_TOBAC|nr:PREDICTED: GDSL esterase/lipase At5g03980-like [Nicotiana tabacum]
MVKREELYLVTDVSVPSGIDVFLLKKRKGTAAFDSRSYTTALPAEVMAENKIVDWGTNSSLNVQLDRMSSHFKTTFPAGCHENLKNSLFLVGEIGGNDLNFGLFEGKTVEELRVMVPENIQTIINFVKRVIGFGATRMVVPGNFPIGCLPIYLAKFMTNNTTAYDEYHCLKILNNLAIFYNHHLQQAIDELKKDYPNITLIYGNAYLWLLQNAASLGLDKNLLQKACCGLVDYNYDASAILMCGAPGVVACANPNAHISWDGIHVSRIVLTTSH